MQKIKSIKKSLKIIIKVPKNIKKKMGGSRRRKQSQRQKGVAKGQAKLQLQLGRAGEERDRGGQGRARSSCCSMFQAVGVDSHGMPGTI